jgi:1-deoxy-D-xylulose-5-phosphate synthase
MALNGIKTFYAIYSTFLQRAFDEIIHDVCAQDAPVTFCIDRAGITGADGETHQGVFDLSYLSLIPNLTIAVPKDRIEFKKFLEFSLDYPHPLAIRYPRSGRVDFSNNFTSSTKIKVGKWERLIEGNTNVTILATGERCIDIATRIAKHFKSLGKEISVINARFVKPLDEEMLKKLQEDYVITIEDNVYLGGFGSMVNGFFAQKGIHKQIKNFAYRDEFIPHGSVESLQKRFGVDEEEIKAYIVGIL